MGTLAELPDELINVILSRLPLSDRYRCRLISPAIRNIIDINIVEIDLSAIKNLRMHDVVGLAARHPNLKKLVLSTIGVTPYHTPHKNLQTGKYESMTWFYMSYHRLVESFSENWLLKIITANPGIEYLGVEGCQFVHDRSVRELVQALPSLHAQLQQLNVTSCVPFLTDDFVRSLQKSHPGLLVSFPEGLQKTVTEFKHVLALVEEGEVKEAVNLITDHYVHWEDFEFVTRAEVKDAFESMFLDPDDRDFSVLQPRALGVMLTPDTVLFINPPGKFDESQCDSFPSCLSVRLVIDTGTGVLEGISYLYYQPTDTWRIGNASSFFEHLGEDWEDRYATMAAHLDSDLDRDVRKVMDEELKERS